jgi:ubiquinone/menaquinone biosynthesis C-methylase UbiE
MVKTKIPFQERLDDWNEVYKLRGRLQHKEDPIIYKDVIPLFKKYNVEKILDLGCGTGRHSIVFAKKGFRVIGIDIAEVAINMAEEYFRDPKLCFFIGDMRDIKFPNTYFDAVFCFLVVHHAKVYEIWKTFDEITRVLKDGKILYITLPSFKKNEQIFKEGIEIEPNTYINLDVLDGMVPHHFFEKKEALTFFKNKYRILKVKQKDIFLEHEDTFWNYYIVSAQKKISK